MMELLLDMSSRLRTMESYTQERLQKDAEDAARSEGEGSHQSLHTRQQVHPSRVTDCPPSTRGIAMRDLSEGMRESVAK